MKLLKNIYNYNLILSDTILAVFSTLFLYCIILNFNIFCSTIEREFVYQLIGACVGMLGFLMAVLAIIFVFKDGKKIDYLKSTESYKDVFEIYWSAIRWVSIILIILFFYFIFDFPIIDDTYRSQLKKFLLLFAFVIIAFKIWRCLWITKKMFLLSLSKND